LLTKEEQELAANAQVLLTKNKIVQEVYELFGRLTEYYLVQATLLPEEVRKMHAKISKGENYLGLPWVMLDYPRHFASSNTFAVRTMFWWGHYFSVHLLLQGSYMQMLNVATLTSNSGWYFNNANDPWQHHFDENVVKPISTVDITSIEKQAVNGFFKISCYLPLSEWERAEAFLKERFIQAMIFIK
jgi:hypothetical protein